VQRELLHDLLNSRMLANDSVAVRNVRYSQSRTAGPKNAVHTSSMFAEKARKRKIAGTTNAGPQARRYVR
jgi:hypothetical protein